MENLDGCPNCGKRQRAGAYSLKVLARVYECPACHGMFCTGCGRAKERDDGCVVCPHCGAAYLDRAFYAPEFGIPEGAKLIDACGTFWP
jgi:predicted RNA-binding Zn-ribbon protein involved in translation (DUF1610 family)